MSSMRSPLPIILCGKSPIIATSVKEHLQPEYEVIHVILSPAAGAAEIPLILEGSAPPASEPANIGTRNYANTPAAVVTGAGYDDAAFGMMREACEGTSRVPWLRPDLTVPTPPVGPEYGKAMVERVKACLAMLERKGNMEGDAVVYY